MTTELSKIKSRRGGQKTPTSALAAVPALGVESTGQNADCWPILSKSPSGEVQLRNDRVAGAVRQPRDLRVLRNVKPRERPQSSNSSDTVLPASRRLRHKRSLGAQPSIPFVHPDLVLRKQLFPADLAQQFLLWNVEQVCNRPYLHAVVGEGRGSRSSGADTDQ